jgi:hypothetical protein
MIASTRRLRPPSSDSGFDPFRAPRHPYRGACRFVTKVSRLLSRLPPLRLGAAHAPLRFEEGERPSGSWRGRRYLQLDGRNAFELSFWCGTCPFLFERMEGANRTLSIQELQEKLNEGLTGIDSAIVRTLAELVPEGDYLPMLLELRPRLIMPMRTGDYFAEDQVATWGIDHFWGLPGYPRTPYYRTGVHRLNATSRLYEFVVPMVPPTWNDQEIVAEHGNRLAGSSLPTCLALSILDVCQPAVAGEAPEADIAHWCLVHFLLDGHHKMEAAANNQRHLRLLSLLSMTDNLARPDDLATIPAVLTG